MNTGTIAATVDAWTKEPDKALGAPVVTARAEESQAVIQAGAFTWRADLPPALGGRNEAPTPTALLLGALAGCAVVFVRDTSHRSSGSGSRRRRRLQGARPTHAGCSGSAAPSRTSAA